MKGYPRAIGIGALMSLVLVACGSDSSPTTTGGGGTISASLNGTAWSVDTGQAQHNVGGDLMVLFAPSTGSYGLAINLPDFDGDGTYALEVQRLAVVTVGADPGWGTTFGDGGGTVTVTSFSPTRITGTFQFTAYPSPHSSQSGALVVTNGQFDLPVIWL